MGVTIIPLIKYIMQGLFRKKSPLDSPLARVTDPTRQNLLPGNPRDLHP